MLKQDWKKNLVSTIKQRNDDIKTDSDEAALQKARKLLAKAIEL